MFVFTDLPLLEHEKSPNISYDNLRKIVHTIVQEVIKLPEFYNQKGFSNVDANQVQSSFEPKTYEDLLATAVINKVRNIFDIIHIWLHPGSGHLKSITFASIYSKIKCGFRFNKYYSYLFIFGKILLFFIII